MVDINKTVNSIQTVETSSDPWCPPSDSGQAWGPYCFHPSAFFEWCDTPTNYDTWFNWFKRAITRFVNEMVVTYPDIEADEIAVVYHRHCYIRRALPADWTADNYAERFRQVYNK